MDFAQILSAYRSKACVLSVEAYPGGGYGNIRIAAGNGLSMAVGIHIIRAGEDIRAAMSAADKEMYEEKRAYYARHPDRRSR